MFMDMGERGLNAFSANATFDNFDNVTPVLTNACQQLKKKPNYNLIVVTLPKEGNNVCGKEYFPFFYNTARVSSILLL